MKQVAIAPGLTITETHYGLAAAGIADHVPDLAPLTWAAFTSTAWTLIPDEQTGEPYKAELTLVKNEGRTVRINLWLAPDLRDSRGPRPHSHPWDFVSRVLDGSYVESRWTPNGGSIHVEQDVEHRTGEANRIGREMFHEVTKVIPGRTLSLMMCGPGMSGWGYLDSDTGAFTPSSLPDGFMDRLREINPHQR